MQVCLRRGMPAEDEAAPDAQAQQQQQQQRAASNGNAGAALPLCVSWGAVCPQPSSRLILLYIRLCSSLYLSA